MPFYLRQIEPIDVGRNFTAGKNDESKHKLVDSQEEAVNRFVVAAATHSLLHSLSSED